MPNERSFIAKKADGVLLKARGFDCHSSLIKGRNMHEWALLKAEVLYLVLDGLGHLEVFPKEMEKDFNEMKGRRYCLTRNGVGF